MSACYRGSERERGRVGERERAGDSPRDMKGRGGCGTKRQNVDIRIRVYTSDLSV